jgi:hypothetical protein
LPLYGTDEVRRAGFIRQWPALPTCAIFLTVHVLPVAYVTLEERYVVRKMYALPGFYGATYYLGYREEFGVNIDDLVLRMAALEERADPEHAAATIAQLTELARTHTHIVPYYAILAQPGRAGRAWAVANYVRAFLVEDIYARLRACLFFVASLLRVFLRLCRHHVPRDSELDRVAGSVRATPSLCFVQLTDARAAGLSASVSRQGYNSLRGRFWLRVACVH